jgi:short-chain fatty acids transporter
LAFGYLAREVATLGASILLDLNHYVFTFLLVGLLLHWRPRSFVNAIASAITPVGGVLIQYPLYAGIVKMMTESGLATKLAHFFVNVSTEHTFPVMIGIYSAFLGCSFHRPEASGSSKLRTCSTPRSLCTCTLDGWCRPTTPPRRSRT